MVGMKGMRLPIVSLPVAAMLAVVGAALPAGAGEACVSTASLARQVSQAARQRGVKRPEFRITRQEDGQALLYWRFGMDSRSFYAVTFRPDGCAVLTRSGQPRRFVFPRSGYNTGVFEEMAVFDAAG